MTTSAKAKSKEQGMILVIVLWFVSCIAVLVASFNATVWSATTVIRDEIWTSRTASVLDAGVALAAFRMLQAGENRWIADGREYREVIDGVNMEIRILDEAGKVDLNSAKPELLTRFLEQFVKTPREALDLTEAILKARERAGMKDATEPAEAEAPPDMEDESKGDDKRAFIHVTQLLDITGFTYKLYRDVEPYITVYNRKGRINIETAERKVMLSLPGVSPIEVERMIASRGRTKDENTSAGDLSDQGEGIKSEKAGPTYQVIVREVGEAGQTGPELQATILTGSKLKEKFHILAWQLQAR